MLMYGLAVIATFVSVAVRNVYKLANILPRERYVAVHVWGSAVADAAREFDVTTFVFQAVPRLPCNKV